MVYNYRENEAGKQDMKAVFISSTKTATNGLNALRRTAGT